MAKSAPPSHSSKLSPLRPRSPVSHLLTFPRRISHQETPLERFDVSSHTTGVPGRSEQFPPAIDELHPTDPGALCKHLVGLVSRLQPLLPASCSWLEPGSIEVVGEHPVDAGGVADVWVGKMGDRRIAIKAYRFYSSSNYLPTYLVSGAYLQVSHWLRAYPQRFYKEALACSRLKDRNIVPFIGAYSAPKYPLALVFKFMDNLNLREYLRDNEDAGRRELVRSLHCIPCSSY